MHRAVRRRGEEHAARVFVQQTRHGIEASLLEWVDDIVWRSYLFFLRRPELAKNGVLPIARLDARDKPARNL